MDRPPISGLRESTVRPDPDLSCAAGPVGEGEFRAPLTQFLKAVVRLANARAAALRLLDSASGELRLIASHGAPPSLDHGSLRVNRDCGVCGDALRSDRTCCAAAKCACAIAVSGGEQATDEERVFVLPLHHRGTPCGVLNLFLDSACELPDAVSALLPAVGDMLGLALENARLAKESLHAGVMQERQLLAGEVHDSLAQNLTCMRMRTALLRDAISRHDDARALKYLAEVDQSLSVAHGRVRELITDFRTHMDPHGLLHALGDAVSHMEGLGGVHFEFDNQVQMLTLSADQELQVFHIVSEALANVVKHAQATRGRLTLEQSHGVYCITVEDDGIGLPGDRAHNADHGHFGLNIMRERARRIGGRIEFGSRSGEGTWMRLSFPETHFGKEALA
ncbi:MAG TPA: ATP-binding protein [Rhodocyclaceae bacterium]|nr:GAF domain-containing protein [Rhodocyclaceae bacterium]HMV52728.1 ATP-binding protein [Rhodocyclaceae bacterium]HNB78211.1 ATP-binding protein [Rhodocyclaceae bacterium]HNC60307.1 ATP-binding protein [Rhodocyclaceae bacterium]HNH12007.1 ATP-binding protein [Rhodocyclaceae bacterium]